MYRYLVVYFYKKKTFFKDQFGFGNAFVSTSESMKKTKVVRAVEDDLKRTNKVTRLCIINYFEASDIE